MMKNKYNKKNRIRLITISIITIFLFGLIIASMTEKADAQAATYFVYIDFKPPFKDKSGWYPAGAVIQLNKTHQVTVVATLEADGDSGFIDSLQYIWVYNMGSFDTCDYCMATLPWILILGIPIVMSYRYFSGRAIDFQDAWDEMMGKK